MTASTPHSVQDYLTDVRGVLNAWLDFCQGRAGLIADGNYVNGAMQALASLHQLEIVVNEVSPGQWYLRERAETAEVKLASLEEQLEAVRDASERVVAADNQSLGAIGAEGERAMVEMTDALYALRVLLLESNPASRQDR